MIDCCGSPLLAPMQGADSGSTLAENISAYQKYRIRPRVLRDISNIDTGVDLFGHHTSIPLGVAPTAMQRLAHTDGELGTARACKKLNVVMGLSSFATTSLEDVAAESGDNPHVLQLYLFEEREHSKKMIARAKKAGYKAVFLTVDTPMLGRRNLEIRNQFTLPKHLKIANFEESKDSDAVAAVMTGATGSAKPHEAGKSDSTTPSKQGGGGASGEASTAGYLDAKTGKRVAPTGPIRFHTHAANPTLSWERDIDWLKQECGPEMQVWVKGVATAEDALLALHHNVDGIVVSNHGGRQLNGALATLDALPEVVAAVQGKIPVHIDGGVRYVLTRDADCDSDLIVLAWFAGTEAMSSRHSPSVPTSSGSAALSCGVWRTRVRLVLSFASSSLPTRSSSAWDWRESKWFPRSTRISLSGWMVADSRTGSRSSKGKAQWSDYVYLAPSTKSSWPFCSVA